MSAHFYQTLTLGSQVRYGAWRAAGGRSHVILQLKSGPRFRLRPLPATDYGVAYEIFFDEVYRWPFESAPPAVRHVVDLGGNVGYSCLYWAVRYPGAAITVFEPHPEHARILRAQLALNGIDSETAVRVHEAAAGIAAGSAFLSDQGSSSAVGDASGIPISIVDTFDVLRGTPCDLLKIDIEGGEYALLEDERFERLAPALVCVEWHGSRDGVAGDVWCDRRLRQLGYEVRVTASAGSTGLIWGRRHARPAS